MTLKINQDSISELLNQKNLSPMMHQYLTIKMQHQDYLLFFRMGDFYEMFFTDAQVASKELGIVLTKRGTIKDFEIPMCGIPFHSYESYLNRLIKAGYKVAICEQTETPDEAKKRGSKSVVAREVVKIITPGTLTEDVLLNKNNYNFLLSIYQFKEKHQNKYVLAWIDISTNNFHVDSCNAADLNSYIYKISPAEILLQDDIDINFLSDEYKDVLSLVSSIKFNISSAESSLKDIYSDKYSLISEYTKEEKIACFVLLDYIILTQKNTNITSLPIKISASTYMRMDLFTQKSLEILKSQSTSHSLRKIIDKTVTSFGSRKLTDILTNISTDIEEINHRLDFIDFFIKHNELAIKIQQILKNIPDAERSISRLLLNSMNVLDVFNIRIFLKKLSEIKALIFSSFGTNIPLLLSKILDEIEDYNHLLNMLETYLMDDLSIKEKDSGYIKRNSHPELNNILQNKEECLQEIIKLKSQYIVETKINNLKIQFNNISGYFIEVPSSKADVLINNSKFKHKQTLSTSIRFITDDLIAVEGRLNKNMLLSINLEKKLLKDCIDAVLNNQQSIFTSISMLSILDVFLGFTSLAIDNNLCKPKINNTTNFIVKNARHLVVETSLKKKNKLEFVSNDCNMIADKSIYLITGPNMAGKSTYLRQNALIIVLAQIGCYVPASYAEIGIVDCLFSRVGAADDLSKGQSTFMIEMSELSIILNYATERSFLILDEIGRGTSTSDGLSIAWATLEYLHNKIKARTLFATHYHELTELDKKLSSLECYYVSVEEHNNEIIFMHTIKKGSVSKSYGLDVAKIAGIPKDVLNRSKEILSKLENKKINKNNNFPSLFDYKAPNTEEQYILEAKISTLEQKLKNFNKIQELNKSILDLNINNITPIDAFNLLYSLYKEYNKLNKHV